MLTYTNSRETLDENYANRTAANWRDSGSAASLGFANEFPILDNYKPRAAPEVAYNDANVFVYFT
ncbi:hypothetical protein FACS1894139_14540 [Planctomycetales bacterium]|nr:hypothetical protein FACS1894108_14080 [Planctomycetales bacterium]GHT07100.1 hypothetical protein FACS1894139_14540 [Planctomycetales bacterium]